MKGYCENCNKVIDETETKTYTVNHLVVCHGCFDKLEGNKVISFGTWKKMTRKERKASRKDMTAYEMFHEANKNKECVICGMNNPLYEVHRINDGKYCYDGETVLLCGECITNNGNFNDLFLVASNVFRDNKDMVDYDLTRKASKPYLCQICKLCETCQNNFDYECTETNDFLYRRPTKESDCIRDYEKVVKELELTKIFTEKKDDEIEKLVKDKGYTLDDKDHNALRG